MKTAKDSDPVNLSGQYVRGADGRIFRVSLWGTTPNPWGRVDGGELEEIARPFRECEAAEVATMFEDKRLISKGRKDEGK